MKETLKRIKNASDKNLNKLFEAVQQEINSRKLKDFVAYIPEYISDEISEELVKDAESLNLVSSNGKLCSQWLSPVNEPYIFNDVNPIHHARDINDFPAICKVRDLINNDPQFNACLDSCLILKYTSLSSSISPHADNEESIDQHQPICNISIGSKRTIEFITYAGHEPVTSVEMQDRSITIMKPGTQSVLKHMVRPKTNTDTQDAVNKIRWCFSFRARARKDPPVQAGNLEAPPQPPSSPELFSTFPSATTSAPPEGALSPTSPSAPLAPVLPNIPLQDLDSTSVVPAKHICLLAGDSFAERLDTGKLGRKSVVVESVARGGAKMHQVMGQLRKFSAENENVVVDKLFISVGTNDIRYCRDGIKHLNGKFKSLCSMIKELFPNSKIFFQSLIPLPCLHGGDWITNSNVINFNSMVFNECKFRRFHILDAFSAFRDPHRVKFAPYPELRNSSLFVGNDIHPSVRRGMGVLARIYLRAIHSRFFDPLIWQ